MVPSFSIVEKKHPILFKRKYIAEELCSTNNTFLFQTQGIVSTITT